MEEGAESIRLTSLLRRSTLYREGSRHLIRNDEALPPSRDYLTDRQANEAISIMNRTIHSGKNFYMHLWFDAPHSPWEIIHPFEKLYNSKTKQPVDITLTRSAQRFPYLTMISSMDAAIGRIRRALVDLGIANNTLVVFLSDNGPENGVGSSHPFRGRKRSVHEGGLRVPSIWEWPGKIPAGEQRSFFAVSTDLFPTLVHAAEIADWRYVSNLTDGISLLPLLAPDLNIGTPDNYVIRSANSEELLKILPNRYVTRKPDSRDELQRQLAGWGHGLYNGKTLRRATNERLVTWYNAIVGETFAGRQYGYKYIVTAHGKFRCLSHHTYKRVMIFAYALHR